MYSSVKSAVKVKQSLTPFFKSNIGVKRGCNLSPTLFNIFFNGLPSIFDEKCDLVNLNGTPLNCLLYADDLVILSSSESGLRSCLETLRGYTSKWRVQVNIKKSKVVIFGSKLQKNKSVIYQWKFGKELLDIVDEYTYLGITLHYPGTLKLA